MVIVLHPSQPPRNLVTLAPARLRLVRLMVAMAIINGMIIPSRLPIVVPPVLALAIPVRLVRPLAAFLLAVLNAKATIVLPIIAI